MTIVTKLCLLDSKNWMHELVSASDRTDCFSRHLQINFLSWNTVDSIFMICFIVVLQYIIFIVLFYCYISHLKFSVWTET